jgi:hypothetical protein
MGARTTPRVGWRWPQHHTDGRGPAIPSQARDTGSELQTVRMTDNAC